MTVRNVPIRRVMYFDKDFPQIITLCGSTKFKEEFEYANKQLTKRGSIVISVGFFGHMDRLENPEEFDKLKPALDELHKRKIDVADAIYVVNKGGYIGSSTQGEIEYAILNNKDIYFMEGLTHEQLNKYQTFARENKTYFKFIYYGFLT